MDVPVAQLPLGTAQRDADPVRGFVAEVAYGPDIAAVAGISSARSAPSSTCSAITSPPPG